MCSQINLINPYYSKEHNQTAVQKWTLWRIDGVRLVIWGHWVCVYLSSLWLTLHHQENLFTLKLQFCTTHHSAIWLFENNNNNNNKSQEGLLASLETSLNESATRQKLQYDIITEQKWTDWKLLTMNRWRVLPRFPNWDRLLLLTLRDNSTQWI